MVVEPLSITFFVVSIKMMILCYKYLSLAISLHHLARKIMNASDSPENQLPVNYMSSSMNRVNHKHLSRRELFRKLINPNSEEVTNGIYFFL